VPARMCSPAKSLLSMRLAPRRWNTRRLLGLPAWVSICVRGRQEKDRIRHAGSESEGAAEMLTGGPDGGATLSSICSYSGTVGIDSS
jgi:hypothetical protein